STISTAISTTAGASATTLVTTTTTVIAPTVAAAATIVSTEISLSTLVARFQTRCLTDVGRQITFTVYFTFADPHLHTDFTIRGQCFDQCIINVCAECMQRYPSFFILLGTSH